MELRRGCPARRSVCSMVMILVCIFLTCTLLAFFLKTLAYAEGSGGCTAKKVSLGKKFLDAEEAFGRACGRCHPAPDPAQPTCISGLEENELLAVWDYLNKMQDGEISGLDCLEPEGKPIFESTCGKCHSLPDPGTPSCISEMPKDDLSLAHTFMESARAGKALYESRCIGCHELINPASHTFEYWSKHLCDGGAKISGEDKQKMFLYLRTRSAED